MSSTQPEPRIRHDSDDDKDDDNDDYNNVCFSQPLHVDDLILTQTQLTPGSSTQVFLLFHYIFIYYYFFYFGF